MPNLPAFRPQGSIIPTAQAAQPEQDDTEIIQALMDQGATEEEIMQVIAQLPPLEAPQKAPEGFIS